MNIKKPKTGLTRRQALIQCGLTPTEIHKLIKDCKTDFIKSGVRNASNLPVDISRRIDFLSQNISKPEAQRIILEWVSKNIVHSVDTTIENVVLTLEGSNNSQEADEQHKEIWRSLLKMWSDQPNNSEVLAYVFGGLRGKPEKDMAPTSFVEDLDRGKGILDGTLVDVAKGDAFGSFISALVEVSQGKPRIAEEFIDEIKAIKNPASEKMASMLQGLIDKRISELNSDQYNLITSHSAEHLSQLDTDSFTVVARMVTNGGTGHRFFRITGVVIGNALYSLSKEDSIRLFPLSGSAILFASKAPTYHLPYLSDWIIKVQSIEESTGEHTSRFEVREIIRRVYDIHEIPYSSDDPERIREWIVNTSKTSEGSASIFHLVDGYLVKFKNSQPRLDEPLECFTIPRAFKFDNRSVVIDDLGRPTSFIDCSSPEILIRKLLSVTKVSESLPKLTNAQISRLAEVASDELDTGHLSSSIQRLCGSIKNLYANYEVSNDLIRDFLELPQIEEQLHALKVEIREKYEEQLNQEKRELSELRMQKNQLEKSIEEQKQAGSRLASKLSDKINNVFKKAADDGLDVLAEVALLKPFINSESSARTRSEPESHVKLDLSNFKGKDSIDDLEYLEYQLVTYARINSIRLPVLKQSVSLMLSYGILGAGHKSKTIFSNAFSAIATSGLQCTVSISTDIFSWDDVLNLPAYDTPFVSPHSLGMVIQAAQSASIPVLVNINGANRAPMESFLPEVLSFAGVSGIGRTLSWRDKGNSYNSVQVESPLYFVMTFVEGKSTYKITKEFGTLIPFLPSADIWESDKPSMSLPFTPSRIDFSKSKLDVNSYLRSDKILHRKYLEMPIGNMEDYIAFSKLCMAIARCDVNQIQEIITKADDGDLQSGLRAYIESPEFEMIRTLISKE